MTAGNLALAGLEQLLNRYVALDPDAPARFAQLHGRVVGLHLSGLEITLYLVADEAGRLQVLDRWEGEPDCLLSGSPLDLVRAGDAAGGARELFAGRVSIRGDTELGRRFGRLLAGLDVDWEEQLSRLTGDVIAHQVGRAARRSRDYLGQRRQAMERNLGEYLTEEARLLPARAEVEAWAADVDHLRDDAERLAARIERLVARRRTGTG
ncbi:MAG: SCP2 sterol-binding domain-containing protein [Gammaproteobacteria bacterium]|jgi:ubiquinone biosynthesis protein UbiJ